VETQSLYQLPDKRHTTRKQARGKRKKEHEVINGNPSTGCTIMKQCDNGS